MLKRVLPQIKSYLIMIFILAYFLKSFFPQGFLPDLMAIIAVFVLGIGLLDITPLNRRLIILLLSTSGLLIWSGPSNLDWASAIIENAGIVTLLLTVPMLGAILYYAPYEIILSSLASRYIRSSFAFYVIAMALVAFLGSLMSLAAVPFSYQLIKPIAVKYPEDIFHKALTRGFIVNLFWAPSLITVAVVLQYVNISWTELAIVGFGFSVLSFVTACILGKCEFLFDKRLGISQAHGVSESGANDFKSEHQHYLFSLISQVVVILTAIVALNRYLNISIYAAVAIVSLILPLIFAMALGKIYIYKQRLIHYVSTILPNMCNEFMLFLSIGFFGYVLGKTIPLASLQVHIARLDGLKPEVMSLLIIIAIAGIAIMGIHPIVTISTLAVALIKVEFGLSNMQLAISFITGYIMYLLLSPFSTMVMMTAALTKQDVYKMGFKLNWLYAIALTLLVAGVMPL